MQSQDGSLGLSFNDSEFCPYPRNWTTGEEVAGVLQAIDPPQLPPLPSQHRDFMEPLSANPP